MAVCADQAEGMGTGGSLNPPPGEVFTGGGLSSVGKGDVHATLLLRPSPACFYDQSETVLGDGPMC